MEGVAEMLEREREGREREWRAREEGAARLGAGPIGRADPSSVTVSGAAL